MKEDCPEYLILTAQVGIRPSGGLRLWDIKFGGQRIVYELALQEAMMSGAGTTPSQVPCSSCLLKSCTCLGGHHSLAVAWLKLPVWEWHKRGRVRIPVQPWGMQSSFTVQPWPAQLSAAPVQSATPHQRLPL